MAKSAALLLLSYLGWSFLPNIGTSMLQNVYYRLTLPAGTVPPQPGTHTYMRDHRRIRILVLTLYLLYTLTQTLYDIKLAGDFYTLLSVDPYRTSEKDIKTRVRRLAAKYHPDKLSTPNAEHERIFVSLRLASETLTNPSHKYAYTHFGPGILTNLPKSASPDSDPTSPNLTLEMAKLVSLFLRAKIPSYLTTLLFIIVLNTFFLPGKQSGKYWRYLIIAASFTFEFYLTTHEMPPLPATLESAVTFLRTHTALGNILPPHLLPFQLLKLTSQLSLSLNIFISQVSALFPPAPSPTSADTTQLQQWISHLNTHLSLLSGSAQRVDIEASGLLDLQFAPFKGQKAQVNGLRRAMKEGMVLGSVRGHPDVAAAVQCVRQRRKNIREGGDTFGDTEQPEDGADVINLLNSHEKFD